MALYGLGQIAMDQGQYDRVEAVAREGLALAEQIGDESGRGNALSQLGAVAEARGDLPQAAQLLEEGLTHCRNAGDIGGQGRALISLGHIYRALDDYARATLYFEESLEQLRTIQLTWGIANILTSLGHLAREQGDYPRAIARYRESLALHRLFGNQGYIAWCFEGMAAAFGAQKQPERTAQLCAAAATLREAAHAPRPPAEQRLYEQTVAVARSALGEAAFQDAWSAGEAYTLEEAISTALENTPDHR
jgi:tetratricopeptide (TPR) repeat protein